MTTAALPGILADIARVAGNGAAVKLAQARGGTDMEIPKNPGPGSQLAKIVGVEAARKITKEIGHGRLFIPMGVWRGQKARRRAAAELSDKGLSAPKVALATDMSARNVHRVRNGMRERMPLFDGDD